MKIAFIGCGEISGFHAEALMAVGFEIAAVCSRPGSLRARQFAELYRIPRVYDDVRELLNSGPSWDALLIAVPAEATLPILHEAIKTGSPILVEKPVATQSAALRPLLARPLPVIVGYNRRFYRPIREIRNIVQSGSAPFMGHLVLPEIVADFDDGNWQKAVENRFIGNSVHAIDMLNYIFGSLQLMYAEPLVDPKGRTTGFAALLHSKDDTSMIQITAMWNSPANVSLSLYRKDVVIRLQPFEKAVVFNKMQRLDPSPDMPIRRYVPIPAQHFTIDQTDERFKPGMLEQARAVRQLVSGKMPEGAATLQDAYNALRLSQDILSHLI